MLPKSKTRIKILLHISLAIQYIHTKVPHVRDVILHKDIASKNVVLDEHFNARLIDFGLAREKDDKTSTDSGRVHYTHPDVGTGKRASESWDYFSFGVIIREMLTSLEPKGCDNCYLKNMTHKKIEKIFEKLQVKMWLKPVPETLNDIACVCLENLEMGLPKFADDVVEEIKDIWRKEVNQCRIMDVPDSNTKCHICMINLKASETSMTQDHSANCRQKIEACIACEKNSFLNPIKCYCGTDLRPVIGSRWGALLVAGNDENNPLVAEALKKDILMLEKLITSLAPRIMGISKNKVHTVVPSGASQQGEKPEQLWPQVKDYLDTFSKDTEVDTLLIYFSCHGAKEVGQGDVENKIIFQLGSVCDSISVAEFETELEKLENINTLMIILDCCYPVMVKFEKRDRKLIQINACKANEMADIGNEGSIFTKYLIQGLKACSEEKMCPVTCEHCEKYWSNRSDFISVTNLREYVKNHMTKGHPESQMRTDLSNIAFYTDEKVVIEFTCDEQTEKISLEYLQEMKTLEEKLFEVFRKDKNQFKVRIQKNTYRMENWLLDCDTLEKVMSAWIHRHPLEVIFESNIQTEYDMETV